MDNSLTNIALSRIETFERKTRKSAQPRRKEWTVRLEQQFNSLTVEELLKDPYFSGDSSKKLFPAHKDDIVQLWEARKDRGAYLYADIEGIGSGKTFKGGLIIMLAALEVLTCTDMFAKFGFHPTKVAALCSSRDANKARRVTFQSLLPFFNTPFIREYFPPDVEIEEIENMKRLPHLLRFPRHNFSIFPGTGQEASALGWDIYAALMDEANYMTLVTDSKRALHGKNYDAAREIFNATESRLVSRFMTKGKVAGLIVAMSNTRYIGDFLEEKDRESKEDKTIFVTRRTMWGAHPPERHDTKMFKFDTSNLLVVSNDVEDSPAIRMIPNDMLTFFIKDPVNSWRLWGDTPVASILPYFSQSFMVDAAIDWERENPYDELKNKFKAWYRCNDNFARFIHVDQSRSHDAACMACCHAKGVREIKLSDVEVSRDLILDIEVDFVVRLDPKQVGQIDFKFLRELIYELTERGFSIPLITYDGFQSMEPIDRLRERGFTVENLSIDRTSHAIVLSIDKDSGIEKRSTEKKYSAAYDALRSVINCGTISIPKHYYDVEKGWTQFQVEAKSLEEVTANGNTTIVPSIGATDDVAQVIAGCVYNCMNNVSPDEFVVESKIVSLRGKEPVEKDRYDKINDNLFGGDDSDFDGVEETGKTRLDEYLGEEGGLF